MKPIILRVSLLIILLISYSCVSIQSPTTQKNPSMNIKNYSYLALGDSYTIGEGVEEKARYPNQTVDKLKTSGINFAAPTIIAKTGWTSDELTKAIADAGIKGTKYDLVTLLIGVNNQYRGRTVENFKTEFSDLLEQAIGFADGHTNQVVVLSIPDWGITPFAASKGTDKLNVSKEIDAYNATKKKIASKLGVHFIDITKEYREIGASSEILVSDKLHPSALVYEKWAEKIRQLIVEKVKFEL